MFRISAPIGGRFLFFREKQKKHQASSGLVGSLLVLFVVSVVRCGELLVVASRGARCVCFFAWFGAVLQESII